MKIAVNFIDAKVVASDQCSYYSNTKKSSRNTHGAEYSHKIINRTHKPLLISYRSGLTTVIDPCIEINHRDNTVVILQNFINFDDNYQINTEHHLKDDDSETLIQSNLERSFNENPSKTNSCSRYEELVTVDQIHGSEDGCYLRSIDCSISFFDSDIRDKRNRHPFYKKNILWSLTRDSSFNLEKKEIVLSIFIIDNEHNLQPFYTVLCDRVVAIIPKENFNLKSGLYINGLVESNAAHSNTYPKLIYLTVNELTKQPEMHPILIWSNYAEALEYQKKNITVKEYFSYKEKLDKAKTDLLEANEKIEKAKFEAEHITRKAKDEVHYAKVEAERLKAKNDKATQWITALSNIGKAIIVLVPIGIALYKLKTTSST